MPRIFNTAGPCRPEKHYMLPPERRVPGVRALIDDEAYFVIHAPRQVGKTTSFRALAQALTEEGSYTALLASCEEGQKLVPNVEGSVAAVCESIRMSAENALPKNLLPPAIDRSVAAEGRLRDLLSRWAHASPRPLVLFLDEIDALRDDALVAVLRQLRAGYPERPRGFPQSVALIGLRDVRDYRMQIRPEREAAGTASPFNVKVESIRLRDFNADEVAELFEQHTAATGQPFTAEAKALAFALTRGQPWLVNALAREATRHQVTDRSQPITPAVLEDAKEVLIQRRDTHLDSLIDRLREPRVRKVIEPILAGELLPEDVLDDDREFAKDLGLVMSSPQGLQIANPIYREVIPRALTSVMEDSVVLPRPTYVEPDGRLRFDRLLDDFVAFWCEHADAFLRRAPYSEAAAQLVFLAFLHKIVNGGGFVDREYAVGAGRIDLCVRWPARDGSVERFAAELKVWREHRPDPLVKGIEQLGEYLARLWLGQGTLLLFDLRPQAQPLPQRVSREKVERQGRTIEVVRL